MHSNLLRYPGCKWNKHQALLKKPALHTNLPQTDLLNKENLLKYLNQFPVIFLKPTLGGGGKGIIKISPIGKSYLLRTSVKRKMINSKNLLLQEVAQKCSKKKYLIQQGLELLHLNHRPIDFRVILLKPKDTWEYIGVMGKCAARNRFVTNHSRGGTAVRLKPALIKCLQYTVKQCEEMEETLQSISLTIAESLNEQYPNITELGLDIAIDTKENIWLLEANTKPQFKLFKYHEDPNLFNKIYNYTKKLRA